MTVGRLGQPCACRRGNLVLESSNGITTEYVLDERGALPTILGAVRGDGTTRLYAYGPEGFAAQMTVGGAVEYPLLDGLGSVRHLTDNNGSIVLYRSYDAFGTIRASGGTSSSRLGYTGELQDTATGLVYCGSASIIQCWVGFSRAIVLPGFSSDRSHCIVTPIPKTTRST